MIPLNITMGNIKNRMKLAEGSSSGRSGSIDSEWKVSIRIHH